jgi:hypothetical protein
MKQYMGIPQEVEIPNQELRVVFTRLLALTGGTAIEIAESMGDTAHEREILRTSRRMITQAFKGHLYKAHLRLPWWEIRPRRGRSGTCE